MKRSIVLLSVIFSIIGTNAQQVSPRNTQSFWDGYEYAGEIPVFVDSIHAMLSYPYAYRNYVASHVNEADVRTAWRHDVLAAMKTCMGPLPPDPETWAMQVKGEEQRDGYKAQYIELSLSSWYRVNAYLLIPTPRKKQQRFPAVVMLHDHGANLSIGKEKVIRPFCVDTAIVSHADAWVKQLYGGQYPGDYLARHGYVVLAIDMPLWGERGRKEGVDRSKYDIIAGNMMELGMNLCAFTHRDDVASARFLATLPFVDDKRIGAAGLSIGAYRAWMLAALHDGIRATFCDCWMITTAAQLTRKYGRKENGGFANCLPGLRNYLDYPDIASSVAPRPMLFIAGKQDKLFPLPGVEAAFSTMHAVWDAFEASDNLETYLLDQGHECNLENQQMMLDFFDKHLK